MRVSAQKLSAFAARWLVKQRYVVEYVGDRQGAGHPVTVFSSAHDLENFSQARLPDRLVALAELRAHSLAYRSPIFVAVKNGEVMGYSFLLIANKEGLWHDSLPCVVGDARETSTWVPAPYRGRGVRSSLLSSQAEYCKNSGLRFIAVIERDNKSSLTSSMRFGAVVFRRNLLVKVVGRNVLSFTTNPLRVYALLGARRVHR